MQLRHEDTRIFDEALQQLNQVEDTARKRFPEELVSHNGFGSILDGAKRRTNERLGGFEARGPFIRAMPRIIFDFTDISVLDGVALRHDNGRPIIALSASGVALIYQAMLRLMSTPSVMPEIGDPELERTDLPFVPLSLDFGEVGKSMTQSRVTIGDYLPADYTREMVARTMADFAVDFVIAHEFRHHQAGHVNYWADVSSRRSIREVQSKLGTADLAMISQALEMDADCYAMKSVLRYALWVVEHLDRFPPGCQAALPDGRQAMFLSIMAPYILFKLFSLTDAASGSWESQSHPAPVLRGMMLQATATECLKRWARDDLLEELPSVLPGIVDVGERQLGSLARAPINKDALLNAIGPVGQQHVSRILKSWAAIEGPLAEFSYVSLGEETARV